MHRYYIEKQYIDNGMPDYKLRNTDDILNAHGIDIKAVKGYDSLDDVNKLLYEKFIVNFMNAQGLESRATLIPKGIYYVEEKAYLVKENPEDEFFTYAGAIVKMIDREGKKKLLHKWIHKDYKHLDITEGEPSRYLRIEYKHQGRNEWLHVKNEKSWY